MDYGFGPTGKSWYSRNCRLDLVLNASALEGSPRFQLAERNQRLDLEATSALRVYLIEARAVGLTLPARIQEGYDPLSGRREHRGAMPSSESLPNTFIGYMTAGLPMVVWNGHGVASGNWRR